MSDNMALLGILQKPLDRKEPYPHSYEQMLQFPLALETASPRFVNFVLDVHRIRPKLNRDLGELIRLLGRISKQSPLYQFSLGLIQLLEAYILEDDQDLPAPDRPSITWSQIQTTAASLAELQPARRRLLPIITWGKRIMLTVERLRELSTIVSYFTTQFPEIGLETTQARDMLERCLRELNVLVTTQSDLWFIAMYYHAYFGGDTTALPEQRMAFKARVAKASTLSTTCSDCQWAAMTTLTCAQCRCGKTAAAVTLELNQATDSLLQSIATVRDEDIFRLS